MSVNCFNCVPVLLAAILLTGCYSAAEQTASQSDVSWFGKVIQDDALRALDPEEFRQHAEEMVNTPIVFHGVVVDEEGNALRDAQIVPIVFDRLVEPFEFPFFAFTRKGVVQPGRNGAFTFKNLTGAGLYLLIKLPGYQPVTDARKLYVYAEGLGPTDALPSAEKPERFVFEIRPPERELRMIRTGALGLPADGEPLEVSLRRVAPYGVEPGKGDAFVTCARGNTDAPPTALYEWWCELSVPGGGAQPFLLEFDRAPETGYQEAVRFGHSANDPRWDDRDDRDVIMRFADGNYAFVTFKMRMDGDYYVAFEGVWNPTGSRLLD